MTGGSHDTDELRARFVANREKVRSWRTGWRCPEVEWPGFDEVPAPWAVLPGDEPAWLRDHAPFLSDYRWFLEARPVNEGVHRVTATWWFGAGHAFERLDVEIHSVPDPGYLAERLALAVAAAALKGWRPDDIQGVYSWLNAGLSTRPLSDMVTGSHRTGFVAFELTRSPTARNAIAARLRMTLTETTLDGAPLNTEGRPVRR